MRLAPQPWNGIAHDTRRSHLRRMGLYVIIGLLLNAPTLDAKEHHLSSGVGNTKTKIEPSLLYVSDYFSFLGSDEAGRVTFALDANRGRDGDSWQAEHLIVLLHDEHQGWADLQGSGVYENEHSELITPPDSPFFHFQGTTSTGLTINSPKNQLTLRIDPIPERHSREHNASRYWMGSAPGTLEWTGRSITGLIIYEHLFMPGFNRLTRRYTDLWTESYGLYAWIGSIGDHLYLHRQEDATRLSPLIGNLVGFSVFNQRGEPMKHLQLTVVRREQALGFYRWPMEWTGKWRNNDREGSLTLSLSDLKVISNFIVGGLAMGIIKGEVTFNGQQHSLYGLAELLI